MSDDEWADTEHVDDDGWDDANQVKGSDDGGWGSGNDDFDVDADAAADADNLMSVTSAASATDQSSVDVDIANLYYEAEDLIRSNPEQSLAKFQHLVDLYNKHRTAHQLSDESRSSYFQSLVHIVQLHYKLQQYDRMISQYEQLLALIPSVTRNEGSDAIDTILNHLSVSTAAPPTPTASAATDDNLKFVERIYRITSDTLQKLPDTDRMVFNINLKLCKTYIDQNEWSEAQRVLTELHNWCRTTDPTTGQLIDDRRNKGSELLEVYALEIRVYAAQHDVAKMRNLYESTKDLSAAVKDPRSQSVIRECWGLMFSHDHQWQRAYAEFYSAFQAYQEIGQRDRAKQCLKYVVVANLLAGGEQNVFDAREAKVYQNEPDIQAIGNLRSAYEKVDVAAFSAALTEINNTADRFIRDKLDSMVRDFQSRAILRMVRAYRHVTVQSLADQLNVPAETVEAVCVQLILDGELNGSIDQTAGTLEIINDNPLTNERYAAASQWSKSASQLATKLATAQMTY